MVAGCRPRTPRNERYGILAQRAAAARRGPLLPDATAASGPTRAPRSASTPSGTPTATTARTSTASGSGSATTTRSTRCRSTAGTCATPACGASPSRPAPSIAPNSSVTVYAGQGEHFGNEYFWNLTAPVFENTTRDDRGMGDGAYLFDPQGDIRAWMMYPCRINCANPAQGSDLARHAAAEGRVDLGHQHRRGADRPRDLRAQDLALLLLVPPGHDAHPRPDDPRPHPGRRRGGHGGATSTGA